MLMAVAAVLPLVFSCDWLEPSQLSIIKEEDLYRNLNYIE